MTSVRDLDVLHQLQRIRSKGLNKRVLVCLLVAGAVDYFLSEFTRPQP
jgi:hypothetical protein